MSIKNTDHEVRNALKQNAHEAIKVTSIEDFVSLKGDKKYLARCPPVIIPE